MLYLFGRLALSDSFYFNQDIHPDEPLEAAGAHRPAEAARRASTPGAPPAQVVCQPLASPPVAEGAA